MSLKAYSSKRNFRRQAKEALNDLVPLKLHYEGDQLSFVDAPADEARSADAYKFDLEKVMQLKAQFVGNAAKEISDNYLAVQMQATEFKELLNHYFREKH